MSIEAHQKAMEAWRVLEEMDEAIRLDVLNEKEPLHISHHVPCSAGLATMVFKRLKMEQDYWPEAFPKLYQRPVSRVWRFYQTAKDKKPEQYAGLTTSFGKRVKPLEVAA